MNTTESQKILAALKSLGVSEDAPIEDLLRVAREKKAIQTAHIDYFAGAYRGLLSGDLMGALRAIVRSQQERMNAPSMTVHGAPTTVLPVQQAAEPPRTTSPVEAQLPPAPPQLPAATAGGLAKVWQRLKEFLRSRFRGRKTQ